MTTNHRVSSRASRDSDHIVSTCFDPFKKAIGIISLSLLAIHSSQANERHQFLSTGTHILNRLDKILSNLYPQSVCFHFRTPLNDPSIGQLGPYGLRAMEALLLLLQHYLAANGAERRSFSLLEPFYLWHVLPWSPL